MGQGHRPQLGRRVKHLHPPAFAAGDLRPVALTDQVRGMANGSVAGLRLAALLHLDGHQGVVAQVDDGHVPVLNEVRVLHKTHGERSLCNRDVKDEVYKPNTTRNNIYQHTVR